MANELCTSLGLIDKNLKGKLIHVAEEHGSDSGFVLGSLMWNASRTDTSVFLLALHNTRSHYEKVAKKLGYDFKTVTVLEPFVKYLTITNDFYLLDMSDKLILERLFVSMKDVLEKMRGSKCLVVDDLSDLLCMGAGVSEVLAFLQACRKLMGEGDTIVIGTHHSENCDDQRRVCNFVAHVAECRLAVAPLKTGFSSDVTGTIHVDSRLFHYKLTDRQVKVFAPGSAGIQL